MHPELKLVFFQMHTTGMIPVVAFRYWFQVLVVKQKHIIIVGLQPPEIIHRAFIVSIDANATSMCGDVR